jgi:hypothetical protein
MTTNLNLPHWPVSLCNKPYDFEHASVSTISNTRLLILVSTSGTNCRTRMFASSAVMAMIFNTVIPFLYFVDLFQRAWIPPTSKSVQHESRNGILMCATHHLNFDNHRFYIRYWEQVDVSLNIPTDPTSYRIVILILQERKFVLVNHSRKVELEQYHGKAILLDPDNTRVPFHTLFIIHEFRVRGRWPFIADRAISSPIPLADWITQRLTQQPDQSVPPSLAPSSQGSNGGTLPSVSNPGGSSGSGFASYITGPSGSQYVLFTNPLSSLAALEKEVKALRQTPTWKQCVIENTSWEGTGTENITRYLSTVGVED